MSIKKSPIHVSPIGENWEIETETRTLGQAETKPQAEELAIKLAREAGTHSVTIHRNDGLVEKVIAVGPENPNPEPEK
jgi:hypothetical protein